MFSLPPHVADLTLRIRRFIEEVAVPAEPGPGRCLSEDGRQQLQAAAREAGVFAPHVGREWGGHGIPLTYWSPLLQAAGFSFVGPQALNCAAPDEGNMHLLAQVATPVQQDRYLGPLAAGQVRSGFAMTEPHPGAGSDPAALATTASPDGRGWVINGEKRFISGANGAGFFICMARNDGHADRNHRAGATMFLIDADTPGVHVGDHIPTIDRTVIGGHHHVSFIDCAVGPDAVLGEVGHGFRYAQVRLGPARLTHCMRWLGLARRAHRLAVARASERQLFGSAMADLGMVQASIADNVIDLETSDALIAKTAWLLDNDPHAGSDLSSIAKVHVAEAVNRITDRAMQILGGDGVSEDFPLTSILAEVRPFRIYDGPSEVHRWAIAKREVRKGRSLG